jgi:cold shock protein
MQWDLYTHALIAASNALVPTISWRALLQTLLKWFNGQKGYGFIAPDGGAGTSFSTFRDLRRLGFSDWLRAKNSFEVVKDRSKESAGNLRV